MKPRRMLVNSFFAEDFVLTTPLALWYLNHGLEISNIREAWEWKPKALYRRFAETVAEHRRRADANPAESIKGDLFKLAGNSIYGKSITGVEKHTITRVCDAKTADKLMRSHRGKRMDPVGAKAKWYEVCERKATVEHNLYTPFGAFVYQYSKLRMLETYYDFFDKYWDRSDFQLLYMDTVSI